MTKAKKVLLAEDTIDMQLMVKASIGDMCDLTCVTTLQDAQKELRQGAYSLLVLDVGMPDGNGFDFCRLLRSQEAFANLPIFFLTGANNVEEKVLGFGVGADDYVTKPLEPEEFRARVQRKLKAGPKAQTGFTESGFRVEFSTQKIFEIEKDGKERLLSLTPLEFKLLSHFLQNEGKIFSRSDLLNLFWGGDVHVSRHTVDTHISSLRKKMGASGASLRSIFKKGYCLSLRHDRKKSQTYAVGTP